MENKNTIPVEIEARGFEDAAEKLAAVLAKRYKIGE